MSRSSLILPLFLVACINDQGFVGTGTEDGGHGPAIKVTPEVLQFGTVTQDEGATVQSFIVESVGEADLEVSGIQIVDEVGSFTIVSESISFVLPPGTSQEVEVAFEPYGANAQAAEALISSNDEDDAKVKVELLGEGAVPELAFDPDPLSFGDGYVGCTKTQTLDLVNIGTDLAEVYAIENTGRMFELYDIPNVPFTLEPGEYVTMGVDFTPEEQDSYTGYAIVTSSEPRGTRKGEQTGDGKFSAEYEDSWEIPVDPPSDIIFYVDQSGSMDDNQASLAANFSTFINELSAYSNDWQIMVVNDDNGCNNSGILTPTTSNYTSRFQGAVKAGGGVWTEAGLTITSKAIENTDGGECNAGFMRSDSMLHIIMVSDEPEQSTGSWSTYVNQVIAKKGSAANVRFSAIAGPVPGGCGSADPGTGYNDAVNATGGVFLSICSNWSSSSNLAMLAEASVNQDTFELSHEAIPETIEVLVDGSVAGPTVWEYEEAEHLVRFTDETRIPTEGQTVVINYAGVATCD